MHYNKKYCRRLYRSLRPASLESGHGFDASIRIFQESTDAAFATKCTALCTTIPVTIVAATAVWTALVYIIAQTVLALRSARPAFATVVHAFGIGGRNGGQQYTGGDTGENNSILIGRHIAVVLSCVAATNE